MKKMWLGLAAAALVASFMAPALADKKGDKVVITFLEEGKTEADDCKISEKEVRKAKEAGDTAAPVCGQLTVLDGELTPQGLQSLISTANAKKGTLTFGYEGTDKDQLLKTFVVWLEYFSGKADYSEKFSGWTVVVEDAANVNEVKVTLTNGADSAIFYVTMSVVIPD